MISVCVISYVQISCLSKYAHNHKENLSLHGPTPYKRLNKRELKQQQTKFGGIPSPSHVMIWFC